MLKEKKYLKLKKSGRRYNYVESNDSALTTLNYFLDDCYGAMDEFRELINDPFQEGCGGNATSLKKEGNKIIITLQWLDDEKDAFETTIEELNCILDQWEELLKKMPEKVVMIRNNTVQNDSLVILEGKN